ncbi:MAG TPA: hypothetical protein VG992_03135 [Candidatus Saccharimonadales bacterium]|nr:hypothetical protein [Candidatus Saccharimonadales bacterium]
MSLTYDFKVAGDHLLDAAFADHQTVPERLEKLHDLRLHAGELLIKPWEEWDYLAHHALHSSLTLACLPSLAVVATHQKHDRSVAEEVTANMSDLGGFIAESRLRKQQTPKIRGQVSEIAVAGVLWWGIANGYWPESDYILPATRAQDHGNHSGRRNGVDLQWRHSGQQRQGVQVKTSFTPMVNSYRPDILVVSTDQLVNARRGGANITLLDALAEGRHKDLEEAQHRIASLAVQTKMRAREYRSTQVVLPRQDRLAGKRPAKQS